MAPAVAGVLYRAMLRSLRPPAHQLVPFTVTAMCDKRHEHGLVKLVVGLRSRALVDMKASTLVGWTDSWEPQPRAINELWKDAAGVLKVIRERFHQGRQLAAGSAEAGMALDRGFATLRLLNDSLTPMLTQSVAESRDKANRDGVLYHVGQVFRHKTFGYRGVIIGWDRVCERPVEWVREMKVDKLPSGSDQPFYWVLPDEGDCEELFGDKRTSKYVAQDNVQLVHGAELRVYHQQLQGHFEGFDVARKHYLPNRTLRHEFPGNYADDQAPATIRPLDGSSKEAKEQQAEQQTEQSAAEAPNQPV